MRSSRPLARLLLVAACFALATACSGRRSASDGADRGAVPPDGSAAVPPEPEVVVEPAATDAAAPPPAVEGLDVRYVAQGGRPPVSMSLHVAPDGAAELDLTSSWSRPSAPADTLGGFAVRLGPPRREALARLVEEGDLMRHDPGEPSTSPDSTTRTLILARDDRRNAITMATALEQEPEQLAALERLLIEIVDEVSRHPVGAVRAGWELVPDGEGVRPTITLEHAGTEPLRVLFFEAVRPGFRLRAEAWFEADVPHSDGRRNGWRPVGERAYSGVVLEQLVAQGSLPAGEVELAPGATYRFALPTFVPPVVEGGVRAHGVLAFRRLGPGPAGGLLTFDLSPRPVAAAPAP
ncbi:MAG: hypothetical protein JXB32_22710 [Deltaproteobacteria bacterium]|nr:hypothetical protein [Deltaproteobacteria bacterium]